MTSLKMSVFTLAMSLNMSIMAADNTNNTTGSDRNLNDNNAGESMKMQNCAGKGGNDKLLCDKAIENDKARNRNRELCTKRNKALV